MQHLERSITLIDGDNQPQTILISKIKEGFYKMLASGDHSNVIEWLLKVVHPKSDDYHDIVSISSGLNNFRKPENHHLRHHTIREELPLSRRISFVISNLDNTIRNPIIINPPSTQYLDRQNHPQEPEYNSERGSIRIVPVLILLILFLGLIGTFSDFSLNSENTKISDTDGKSIPLTLDEFADDKDKFLDVFRKKPYYIVLASFSDYYNAQVQLRKYRRLENVQLLRIDKNVLELDKDISYYFRVVIPGFNTKKEAQAELSRLKSQGIGNRPYIRELEPLCTDPKCLDKHFGCKTDNNQKYFFIHTDD